MQHGEPTGSYSASPDSSQARARRTEPAKEPADQEADRRADIKDIFAEAQDIVAQPDPYDPLHQSTELDAEADEPENKLSDEPFIPESGQQTPIPPNDDYAYDPDKLGQAFEKRNHLQPPKPEKEDEE